MPTHARMPIAAVVLALVACGPEPSMEPPRVVAPGATAPTAPPPTLPTLPPAPATAARVLYRDGWHGAIQLVGVDAEHHVAFLRMEADAPKRVVLDTIDYQAGKRVDRWEATEQNAAAAVQTYPVFRPMAGTFDQDLVRFASVLRASGPWHLRGRPLRPTVAVSSDGDHILYGGMPTDRTDGDWLYLADRNGRSPRRLDPGVRASYAPVFSPDGTRVAWKGCVASPCGYALFVARVSGGSPERVTGVPESSAPVWSHDGKFIYAVGRTPRQGTCLFKVVVDATWDTKQVRCAQAARDVEFVQDPAGRTAVFTSARGNASAQTVDYTWLLLEDGQTLGTQSIPRASGSGILSDSGLLVMPLQRGGVGAVDLVSGKSGAVADADGWFTGLETTKWVGDWVILLRRTPAPDAFELVAVDARETAVGPK